MEQDGMTVYDAGSVVLGWNVQLFKMNTRHIVDLSALAAYKMVMGRGVAIKVISPVAAGQLLYLSGLYQQIQIAVNRSQTDVGKLFADAGV